MRNTKQRKLIFSIVDTSSSHPTADDIYRECLKTMPNISLGTVYRNLNYLVINNKIRRLKTMDNVDKYDKLKRHNHFYCLDCCKIIYIYDNLFDYGDDINGNKVLDCKINFEGICKECLERKR